MPIDDSAPAVEFPREWEALNMLDTLTSRATDTVVVLDLVATNPDLCDHGTDAVTSALLSITQQLQDALDDMRCAQEALWHHYRERRASGAANPWLQPAATEVLERAKAAVVAAKKKQAAQKPAAKKPVAKVAAKRGKK